MVFQFISSRPCRGFTDDDTLESLAQNSSDGSEDAAVSSNSQKLKLLYFRLPWLHISVLSIIVMTGVVVEIVVQHAFDSEYNQTSFFESGFVMGSLRPDWTR